MNPLQKRLEKLGENTVKRNQSPINEVKLLLETNASEERELLKSMGLGESIRVAERAVEDSVIRSGQKDAYGRTIIHFDEVAKLCADYRLYLKKANQYMGTIPNELGAEMLRYTKDTKIAVGHDDRHSRFYMVAPPKMFRGYKTPMDVLNKAFGDAKEARAERIRARNEDPILLYRLPENDNYFAVIKSWGSDFTPLRRLYGIMTTKKSVLNLFNLTTLVNIVCMTYLAYLQQIWFISLDKTKDSGWFIGGVIIDGIILILALCYTFNWSQDIKKSIVNTVTGSQHNN